ncbi:MAG: aminotransferase class I/II-fold pyridoxal phosphate-dependent enzyme, partial [Nitrospirae bacterium]|nr:aminotransferase class I/II-fold pyridoxal phosphate-dependent enzyme [Nitrospirota bacterium]
MENVKWFKSKLQNLRVKNLLRKLTLIDSAKGPKISIAGKQFINFSSNDYLGLSQRPEIIKSAVSAFKKYGFGSGSSRLLCGTYIPHKKLEERIAEFKKTESALLFNTGYAANTGIIPAIASAGWTILSDELNHASIIDGLRLSKAEIKIYRHRDTNHLEALLKKSTKNNFIVTDAVFSMDGDIAPLKDIAFLSKKYKALLMIDDAHGTG